MNPGRQSWNLIIILIDFLESTEDLRHNLSGFIPLVIRCIES